MRTQILSYIENLILEVKADLRSLSKNQELIAKLRELEKIKQEILFMSNHSEILKAQFYRVEGTVTDSSEIRLMDDCDTENMSYWVETSIDGSHIRLREGDIILKMK